MALTDPSRHTSARHCPQCYGEVRRVEREAGDKLLPDAELWRRYRCKDKACGWVGLLQVRRSPLERPEQADRMPTAVRIGLSALVLVLVAGMAWGLLHVLADLIEN